MPTQSKQKEVKTILTVLNSSPSLYGEKYSIGNKLLAEKTKQLESENLIKFNPYTNKWEKA